MDQPLSSPQGILNAELARLYERRLVVDELILCLEKYASCASRAPAGIPDWGVTAINVTEAP